MRFPPSRTKRGAPHGLLSFLFGSFPRNATTKDQGIGTSS